MRPLLVRWLGLVPYAEGVRIQERLVAARRRNEVSDTLLLLEHPPVITLGRGARPEHVRITPDEAAERGITIHESGRGGDVTFHGPGQLVGYPVVALHGAARDARAWLRLLEEVMILTAADFGVAAERVPGLTGVWVGDRKLGAIGVRLSAGWITSHGFALNVSVDLAGFDAIVPCGIRDRGVTSLRVLTGRDPGLRAVAAAAAGRAGRVLGLNPEPSSDPAERLAIPGTRPLSSAGGAGPSVAGGGRP